MREILTYVLFLYHDACVAISKSRIASSQNAFLADIPVLESVFGMQVRHMILSENRTATVYTVDSAVSSVLHFLCSDFGVLSQGTLFGQSHGICRGKADGCGKSAGHCRQKHPMPLTKRPNPGKTRKMPPAGNARAVNHRSFAYLCKTL